MKWICTTGNRPWLSKGDLKWTPAGRAGRNLIVVDPARKYQEIDGFGGCFNEVGWTALTTLTLAQRDATLRSLFSRQGCNFNICRMPIGASDFGINWYSLNDTPGDFAMRRFSLRRDEEFLIPYILAAMKFAPKLRVWASPWSPPAWMKDNNDYPAGYLRHEPKILAALALYLAKFVREYQKRGIHLYAIHPQNEPAAKQIFPSCLWNGAEMRNFIRDYLGPRFERDRIKAQIWLGTINDDDIGHFARPVLDDERAARFISGVGYQWAGKGAIAATHENWPNLRLMQTETECGNGSNDWAAAEYTFGLMRHYFQRGANSYMYWNMVLDETSLSSWGWKQNAMITINRSNRSVIYNPEFYLFKHFAHFVRPEARRVEVAGEWENALAFVNRDKSLAIVAANVSDVDRTIAFRVGDQTIGPAKLPARSFNTFSGKV